MLLSRPTHLHSSFGVLLAHDLVGSQLLGLSRMNRSQIPVGSDRWDVVPGINVGWDRFLALRGGDVVQSSMWGVSKSSLGQEAVLVTKTNLSEIEAGALLVVRRIGPGIRVGYVARGPVVGARTRFQWHDFLNMLYKHAKTLRCIALLVQPPVQDDGLDAALASRGFVDSPIGVAPDATIVIDVRRTDDELLASMSRMRRRNVRKALGQAISIEPSADIALFHRLHVATAARQKFAALSISYFQSHWDALAPSGGVRVLVASSGGIPLAALWLSNFAGTVTFRAAGWNSHASASLNVNEALHWEAIQWARSQDAHTYDFGGFDRPAAEAIAAGQAMPSGFDKTHSFFKLGFGGTPILFPRPKLVPLNIAANRLSRAVLPRLLRSPVTHRAAQRLRSG